MKNLLICAAFALVAGALVGCGSGDDAPTDPEKILGEMKQQTPAGLEPVPPEEATAGMQTMGGGKKGK